MKSCRINTQDRHLIVDTDGARILVPCQCKATDVLTFGDWDERSVLHCSESIVPLQHAA